MAKTCRKCREKKKRNMESSPERPPRGSLLAARRKKMREAKMRNLAEHREKLAVERSGGDAVS